LNSPYYLLAGSNVKPAKEMSLVVVSPFSVTLNLSLALISFTIITIFLSASKVTGLADEPAFL